MIYKINTANDMREMMFEDRKNYFSLDGYGAMLEYFDEVDPDFEFDCIGICCEFTEYGDGVGLSIADFISDYGTYSEAGGYTRSQWDALDDDEKDEVVDEMIETISDYTWITKLSNGDILLADF